MFQYLTYDEYKSFGGTVSEEAFPNLNKRAQYFLDYITFDRIPQCWKNHDELPEYIKLAMVDIIDETVSIQTNVKGGMCVTKYSNDVETLTYAVADNGGVYSELTRTAFKYLPTFLTARAVNYDVTKYLQ